MTRERLTFLPPRSLVHTLLVLLTLGTATALGGLFLDPRRAWASLLLVGFALIGLSLGGALFVAMLYVTGARWATTLRRVPEAMAATFPAGALLMGVALLGGSELYPWFDPGAHEAENVTPLRELWLDRSFFLVRAALYMICWYGFIRALVRASRRQDADGLWKHTQSCIRLSAAFLVVFGITFWLASQDWIMSLESEWHDDGTRRPSNWASTIYGLYHFSGLFLGGLAVLTLLLVWLRRVSILGRVVDKDQLHDLGKLLFAFSVFWMYIWFCQYLLIWYVNITEEATYFVLRQHGAWQPLLLAVLALNGVIPFLVLLPRVTKRSPNVLAKICVVVILGRWLDLYVLIAPAVEGPEPAFGLLEIGLAIGAVGLFGLEFFRVLARAPLVPLRDPYLGERLRLIGEDHLTGMRPSRRERIDVGTESTNGPNGEFQVIQRVEDLSPPRSNLIPKE